MTPRAKNIGIAVAICAVASAMIFMNLSRTLLWQDEAQTALLARTTLQHGIPIGHDGANSLSQEQGRDMDSHGVFRYHPWAQFYIAAASFALFGESTFTARLPFALFGVATVALTYVVALNLWRSVPAAAASALFLTFSVPFLLLVRQCRYYSPLAFFVLLAVFAYLQILRGHKRYVFLLVAASIAAMHTFHLCTLVLLAAMSLHTLVWRRGQWKYVVLPAAAIVLVHVPWFYWILSVATYGHPKSPGAAAAFCVIYLFQGIGYIVTPVALVAYVALRLASGKDGSRGHLFDDEQRSAAIFFLLLIAMSIVAFGVTAPYPFFRYLAGLPPIGALLFGPLVPAIAARGRKWAMVTVAATLAWMVAGESLAQYRYELFTPFRGPIRGIVEYLDANARPDDVVVTQYGDMPLKFYTRLRVVGGLTGEDLEPGRNARLLVNRRHFVTAECERVGNFMASFANPLAYEVVPLDCPDLAFETREDLRDHVFRQPTNVEPVLVYKRRE